VENKFSEITDRALILTPKPLQGDIPES
jgi:hypothetical protein